MRIQPILIVAFLALLSTQCTQAGRDPEYVTSLTDGWQLISSENVTDITSMHQLQWASNEAYAIQVPATVLGALVDAGVYEDPFFGFNLKKIDKAPFQKPWFYRTVFDLNPELPQDHVRLVFEGINYRANIWVNGKQVASADTLEGSFRVFPFDVTEAVQPENNVLVVEIIPPAKTDLSIGWVDWNPWPPDKNMGLWREVFLKQSGAVSLDDVFVQTKLNLETLQEADLTLSGWLTNHTQQPVSGLLQGSIEDLHFKYAYELNPGEKKKVVMSPETHAGLHFDNPKIWWPNTMGDQPLYGLTLAATVNGEISDKTQIRFGIREVGDYINEQGHRGYTVNGKKVLIRGGGWVDDLFLREDPGKLDAQLRYTKHMNLNTIRMEGFWGSTRQIYDLCDEYGLLMMIGWSCHWEWTYYCNRPQTNFLAITSPEDIKLHSRAYRDQVMRARNHPSVMVWTFGSDMLPVPELERALYRHLDEVDPTRPTLAGCRQMGFGDPNEQFTSEVSGPVAVKMVGPYKYVTPNYWYEDKEIGGAFGFNTETGPGLQPVPLESVRKMTPDSLLWALNSCWDFHCGRNEFAAFEDWIKPFNQRYGGADNVEEFAQKAQLSNYEAIRGMFEAFAVNKPEATGVIQWMLNSSWPCHLWQLFDWYLMPNGAFYGTKTACQPVNVIYNYADHAIYLTNETMRTHEKLTLEVKILDLESNERFNKTMTVHIDGLSSEKVLKLPAMDDLSRTYFLDLRLNDTHAVIARNFYWLSTEEDVLDFPNSKWYITPNSSYADMTGIDELPRVDLDVMHTFKAKGDKIEATVTLTNPSRHLAFFIELTLAGNRDNRTILPVFWDDNYISLLPGETRTVNATLNSDDLHGQTPIFRYQGINTSSK